MSHFNFFCTRRISNRHVTMSDAENISSSITWVCEDDGVWRHEGDNSKEPEMTHYDDIELIAELIAALPVTSSISAAAESLLCGVTWTTRQLSRCPSINPIDRTAVPTIGRARYRHTATELCRNDVVTHLPTSPVTDSDVDLAPRPRQSSSGLRKRLSAPTSTFDDVVPRPVAALRETPGRTN